MMEILESRTLLSVAAVNAQIQADQAQIKTDLLQFRADVYTISDTLKADVKAIYANDPKAATTLTPLVRKLHQDVTAMHVELDADLLKQSSAVQADKATLLVDTAKFVADKGNPTARTADRATILADRVKLQNDMIAGLNARIATRKAWNDAIFSDLQAISTAVQNDANASPRLKTDVQKFTTDRQNGLTKIQTDLNTIKADRTKLAADLTALQSQPPLV